MSDEQSNGTKRPRISKNTYDATRSVGRIEYRNGSAVEFDLAQVGKEMLYAMAARGIHNVVRAEANDEADDEGRVFKASEVVASILDGSWAPGTGGGAGGRAAQPSDLELAMAQHFDKPLDWVRNHYMPRYLDSNAKVDKAGRTRGHAAAIRKLETHPAIAPILAKLVASRGRENKSNALDLTQFAA